MTAEQTTAAPAGSGIGEMYTPLVPEVMLNLLVEVYHPPTKIALLREEVSKFVGSPVVSQ
jgi:hypothetical protein